MTTQPKAIVLAEVLGSKGTIYEIRQSQKDGRVYCSCPAWRFGRGKDCKHLKAYNES